MIQEHQGEQPQPEKTPEQELIERNPKFLFRFLKASYHRIQLAQYYDSLSEYIDDFVGIDRVLALAFQGGDHLDRVNGNYYNFIEKFRDFLQKAGLCDPENPKCARVTVKDKQYKGLISDGYMFFDLENMVDEEGDIVFHFYQDKDSTGEYHLDNPHKVSEMKKLIWIEKLPY